MLALRSERQLKWGVVISGWFHTVEIEGYPLILFCVGVVSFGALKSQYYDFQVFDSHHVVYWLVCYRVIGFVSQVA